MAAKCIRRYRKMFLILVAGICLASVGTTTSALAADDLSRQPPGGTTKGERAKIRIVLIGDSTVIDKGGC